MKKNLWLCFVFWIFSLFFPAFADDWTLGVMEFSFRQNQSRSVSASSAASSLPQLIIEQFSNESVRTIPEKEILDRKLKELQTARLSLFLQLSKEYKTRDSLLLTEPSPRKLERAIKTQMQKIRDIESQIDENLEKVQETIEESAPKIQRDEKMAEEKNHSEPKNDGERKQFPFRLPFRFFQRGEENKITSENVVLYKNDSTALFKPSEKSMEAGFTSWDFEQEVVNAKINGLISGEITVYGDYCSVTVNLRIYPGAQILGSVTEVGLLSDLMPLAGNIARNLDPKIANALPILLEFEIEPKLSERNAKISIDDVVFPLLKTDGTFDNKIIDEAGIHRVKIESEGYEDLSFSYAFTGENHFFIHANLVPVVQGIAKIRLKKSSEGIFNTYALSQSPVNEENPVAEVRVNSKSVLGVFSIPKSDEEIADNDKSDSGEKKESSSENIAFFRIPEKLAVDGANLVVNAKPFDREANIDKRRRWMYGAYTGLILTLPFTFYYKGAFTAENTAYSQGRGDYDKLLSLQTKANVCAGITAAFGVWTVIELVRYLWAADRVLPAKAKVDKKALKAEKLKKMQEEFKEAENFDGQEQIVETQEIEVSSEPETESEGF